MSGDALATDVSGKGRHGVLSVYGTGAFDYAAGAPGPLFNTTALSLTQTGTAGSARLTRTLGTGEYDLSDADWSFAGWFRRTTRTDDDFIFYLGTDNGFSGGGDELQLYCASGSDTVRLNHYNASNAQDLSMVSGASALTGVWHHVAVTFTRTNANAGVVRAYLNGSQYGSAADVAWALRQDRPMVFGGHASNATYERMFNGGLDDLVLFSRALSAGDVAALATRTVGHFGGLGASNGVTVSVIASESAPLLSGAVADGGGWSMVVSGPSGAAYTILASTNLTAWTPLTTVTSPPLPFVWKDPETNAYPRRFYRVRLGP
jgi:hypothetical protein